MKDSPLYKWPALVVLTGTVWLSPIPGKCFRGAMVISANSVTVIAIDSANRSRSQLCSLKTAYRSAFFHKTYDRKLGCQKLGARFNRLRDAFRHRSLVVINIAPSLPRTVNCSLLVAANPAVWGIMVSRIENFPNELWRWSTSTWSRLHAD